MNIEDRWPNTKPVVDGIVPANEVPQDPDLLEVDGVLDSDPELEMED